MSEWPPDPDDERGDDWGPDDVCPTCGRERVDPDLTTLTVPDSIKMLRETLSVAQSRVGTSPLDAGRRREHMDRLQRLIDDCERQRPTGPDGKHGDRHTATCGCALLASQPDEPEERTDREERRLAAKDTEEDGERHGLRDATWDIRDHRLEAVRAQIKTAIGDVKSERRDDAIRGLEDARDDIDGTLALLLAATPDAPEGLDPTPWKPIALALKSTMKGIAFDVSVTTMSAARRVAMAAVDRAEAEIAAARLARDRAGEPNG